MQSVIYAAHVLQPSPLSQAVHLPSLKKVGYLCRDPPPMPLRSSPNHDHDLSSVPKQGGKKRRRQNPESSSLSSSRADLTETAAPGAVPRCLQTTSTILSPGPARKKTRRFSTRPNSPCLKRELSLLRTALSPALQSVGATEAESATPAQLASQQPPAASATSSIQSLAPATAAVEVRMISPTVRGIAESARILLSSGEPPASCPSSPNAGVSAFPQRHYGGILSFPTETIYALTACVGLQHSIRLGGSRSGSTSSSCSEVGLSAGASDAGNGQQVGDNISGIDRRKFFLLATIYFWPIELYIENHLMPIASPQHFTPLFLPLTSPLSLAPQEPLPPLLRKK